MPETLTRDQRRVVTRIAFANGLRRSAAALSDEARAAFRQGLPFDLDTAIRYKTAAQQILSTLTIMETCHEQPATPYAS